VATDDKVEVKISVSLELKPIEKVSEHTLISGKRYRKQKLQILTLLEKVPSGVRHVVGITLYILSGSFNILRCFILVEVISNLNSFLKSVRRSSRSLSKSPIFFVANSVENS
jgi:hypothetical protein